MKPLLEVLSAPDLTIQKGVQTTPSPMKPLLEVFTTPVDPIILYSPLPVIQPLVTDTHAIPWVYQVSNQENQGEVSDTEGFLGQPEVARTDCLPKPPVSAEEA